MAPTAGRPEPDTTFERTSLAWNRSGLAVVACIAVLVRYLWPLRGTAAEVALALVALASMIWAIALFRLSAGHRGRRGALLSRRGGLLVCAGTTMLAAVGFVLAFVPHR